MSRRPASPAGAELAPSGREPASEGAELAAAELLLGHRFERATWRRELCLRALTADGEPLALPAGPDGLGAARRCEGGRLLASWRAPEGAPPVRAGLLGSGEDSEAALAAWRRLDPELADPDGIRAAWEYFPLGPAAAASRSFLRVHLREADAQGSEVFVVRPAGAPAALMRPGPGWALWWPLPWPRTDGGPAEAGGVRVLGDDALAEAFGLPELRRAAEAGGAGFLPGTPWAERWRVCRVEEHCRSAHLGLWGVLLRLKHSVLAVHLRREGGSVEGAAGRDLLYIDKNADVGVGWRRAGFRERFSEAPRAGHAFEVDLPVHGLWSAVAATRAFAEPQEVSNCQHFVRESLAELAARGHLRAPGGSEFTLRNQALADALRTCGYLDEACKARPGSEGANRAWQALLSWGCKVGAARLLSPWAERFALRRAAMAGGE